MNDCPNMLGMFSLLFLCPLSPLVACWLNAFTCHTCLCGDYNSSILLVSPSCYLILVVLFACDFLGMMIGFTWKCEMFVVCCLFANVCLCMVLIECFFLFYDVR